MSLWRLTHGSSRVPRSLPACDEAKHIGGVALPVDDGLSLRFA